MKAQKLLYDAEFAGYSEYKLQNWHVSYINRIFKVLNLQQNDVFLDVGVGGSGYTVIESGRKGIRSIGVDTSSEGMKKANRFAKEVLGSNQTLCDFVVCSATHLPFKRASISKIVSIAVLEHIPRDEEAISEISRVAKKGAEVLVTVPNTYRRIPPFFAAVYKFHDKKVGHLRHYSAEDLVNKFRNFLLREVYYHAHTIKILQFLLSFLFPCVKKRGSKVWWKLEKIDYRLGKVPTGMHLSIHLKKLARVLTP